MKNELDFHFFFFKANWVENIPSLFSVWEKVMNLPEGRLLLAFMLCPLVLCRILSVFCPQQLCAKTIGIHK